MAFVHRTVLPSGSVVFKAMWSTTSPDGRRVQRSKNFSKEKDARLHAARMTEQVEGLGIGDADGTTCAVHFDKWLAGLEARAEKSPTTLRTYRQNLARLAPLIGRIRVEKLTPGEITDAYTALLTSGGRHGRPLSGASVRLAASTLHNALENARLVRKLIRINPARDASVPATRKHRPVRPFTPEEAARLIAAAKTDAARVRFVPGIDVIVQLLMASSIRRAELLALRWIDIDFDGCTIRISGNVVPGPRGEAILREDIAKTEHSRREITVPAQVIALLRRHKAEQAEHALQWGREYHRLGLVFAGRDGRPQRPSRMTDNLRDLMKLAGVAKGKQPTHAWRHLSATILLHAGEDLKTVSQRLGHSSPVTTLSIYSHTDRAKDAGASDTIGRALTGLLLLSQQQADEKQANEKSE